MKKVIFECILNGLNFSIDSKCPYLQNLHKNQYKYLILASAHFDLFPMNYIINIMGADKIIPTLHEELLRQIDNKEDLKIDDNIKDGLVNLIVNSLILAGGQGTPTAIYQAIGNITESLERGESIASIKNNLEKDATILEYVTKNNFYPVGTMLYFKYTKNKLTKIAVVSLDCINSKFMYGNDINKDITKELHGCPVKKFSNDLIRKILLAFLDSNEVKEKYGKN